MSNRWKLKYEAKRWRIHNQKGKDLSYHPNSGIRILVEDGYAFKDVNRNGEIDPFEDWRLPMKRRIQDFTERYQLISKGKRIYYKQGFAELPQDLLTQLQESEQVQALMEEDRAFFQEHAALTVLLLLFDQDDSVFTGDYIIQLFIDSLDMGVLDKVFYTIKKAFLNYVLQNRYDEQKNVLSMSS